MSFYLSIIKADLDRQGKPQIDPRHVEAFMRLEYSTLDHLTRRQFSGAVKRMVREVEAIGPADAERLAKSYGL
jgi:hypothetical protein